MGGAFSTNGGKRNAYRLLVGEPEGRRPLGRPRRRWLDNIRMDLVEMGWGDVDWIGLSQCGRCVWLTTLPQSVSRSSRQCGILNIPQPYRPPRSVTGMALFFYLACV
jgi:hypothetical protein